MNYTKGEWKVWWENPDDKENSDLRIKLNKNLGGQEDIAIVMAPYNEVKESEANARLMAQAPKMYEALKEITELAPRDKLRLPYALQVVEIADRAIAKVGERC